MNRLNPHESEVDRMEFYCESCKRIRDQDGHIDGTTYTCNYCGNENEYNGGIHAYADCPVCDTHEVHIDNQCLNCGSLNNE